MPAAIMNSHDLRSSIGFTPVIELRKLNPNPAVRLLAKLEGNNPRGCGGRHPTGEASFVRNDRSAVTGPWGPIPEHLPVSVHVRSLPSLTEG